VKIGGSGCNPGVEQDFDLVATMDDATGKVYPAF
jgi:hypothetical protein